jgi:hypothetical protein
MKAVKTLVLMLAFMIPSMLCLAVGTTRTERNEKQDEGTPVEIKSKHQSGTQKDDPCITASISGHTLTMNFAQNIGSVLVEISDGQSFMVVTPDNVQAYITSSGSYTVNFTLSNGDEYYGNFVVY